MDEAITKLIQYLENASPAIWNVMLKQVYMDGIGTIIITTSAFIGLFFLRKYASSLFQDDKENIIFVDILIYGVSALVMIITITGIFRFINPEYYAIKNIIDLLQGK